jgi:transitional endoplasmic reticulum ATPase
MVMDPEEVLKTLRDAVSLSPGNAALRRHLADTLLRLAHAEEAETEYRRLLASAPDDTQLKLGLAGAYCQQGKNSHALVIVEDLLKNANTPPRAYALHARLMLRAGQVERAVRAYKKAIDLDPAVADAALAEELGIGADDADGEVVDGRVRLAEGPAQGSAAWETERPRIAFADVGGMDSVKDEIRMKIIHPLQHPEIYKAYGKTIGGGILMYGPPGCGKTYLARATAGDLKGAFLSVGIHDVLDMWIGSSERNLHDLFEQARSNAPCVLFFDEVDALGASRSDMRQSAGRQIINQFLSELDGVHSSNEGVLILAATNAPWHLDSAFRRPGRFDRVLFVPPPDAPARAAILRVLCRGKPVQDVDFEHLARKTDDFSGADLKAMLDAAVESKLREAMTDNVPRPLTTKDLLSAAKGVRPSTKEWFATARNYAIYSNQGGLYDDILKYLRLQ